MRPTASWLLLSLALLSLALPSGASHAQTRTVVPLGGNAFITRAAPNGEELVDDTGLHNWTSKQAVASVYFYVKRPGQLDLSLVGALNGATRSTVEVSVEGQRRLAILASGASTFPVGRFHVARPGYVKVDLRGVRSDGDYYGDISGLDVGGSATSAGLVFADDPANFYWSRRGPSGHLGFSVPDNTEYFYSEVRVPKGHDHIGSYFMANGFNGGYSGIQVNSASERRVLFSVWDSPTGKTTLLKKGADVIAQDFGGEGTGGQSFLRYDWKPGQTYRLITRAHPDGQGSTLYSAWFGLPCASGRRDCPWKFIATWKYDGASTYQKGVYSFIECFNPGLGYLDRMAWYGNQWAVSNAGAWTEMTSARFTVDATAANRQRLDITGGALASGFYLRNTGFFNRAEPAGTVFARQRSSSRPNVNLAALPEPAP